MFDMSTPGSTSGPTDEPVDPTLTFKNTADAESTAADPEPPSTNDAPESSYPARDSAGALDDPENGRRETYSEDTVGETSTTRSQPSSTAAFPTTDPHENLYQSGYSTPIATAERTPAETAPDQPWSAPVEPQESTNRPVRMRTVVFGLVLLVIAGAVLVGQLTDVTVDTGAVVLALMIGCGVLLLVGARRS
jgi:hypothetical protein